MAGPRRIRVHALIDGLGMGGAEMLLAEFAPAAAAGGIDLTVGYFKPSGGNQAAARLEALGIEPREVRVTSLVDPRGVAAVRRHLQPYAPDVVHTHLGAADVIGTTAARTLGIPAVSTVHAMDWVGANARERSQLRLMGLARRRCARRVVVVSESARSAYLATGWDRPERVVTVHNGVTGEAVPGAGRAVREELGIAPDAPVVLVLAALRPEKAHDVAFEAAARLAERFPGLRLLVAGDGPMRPEIERLAARHGDLVAMAGYRADVMAVLDAADVVLQPSHIDAFPTTLLEAAAASVPVVATGVGGIPEIVIDGETGVLVEPPPDAGRVEEAVGRVLADEDLRRGMGAAARRRYEREFTLDRWVARTRTVYESVLNGA